MSLPPAHQEKVDPATLYIHPARGRHGREIDPATERFVDETRMGASE
jgi:hopanoid C-3 methylase